jgi:hypothetical protein
MNGVTDTESEIKPLPTISTNNSVSNYRLEDTLIRFSKIFSALGVLLGIYFLWESGLPTSLASM